MKLYDDISMTAGQVHTFFGTQERYMDERHGAILCRSRVNYLFPETTNANKIWVALRSEPTEHSIKVQAREGRMDVLWLDGRAESCHVSAVARFKYMVDKDQVPEAPKSGKPSFYQKVAGIFKKSKPVVAKPERGTWTAYATIDYEYYTEE